MAFFFMRMVTKEIELPEDDEKNQHFCVRRESSRSRRLRTECRHFHAGAYGGKTPDGQYVMRMKEKNTCSRSENFEELCTPHFRVKAR